MRVDDRLTIVDIEDDARLTPVLEPVRRWSAYALCDMDPPHRQYARFIGAVRDDRVVAVLLIYTPPGFTSVLPSGAPDDIAAIMAQATDLPPAPLLIVQRPNRAALESRYAIGRAWTMLRMAVQPVTLQPLPPVDAEVVALTAADLLAVQRLYAVWPDTVFTPFMFEHGVYHGAYRNGELVAIAGTHAISARHQIAVIGNVFTHPDHRGRGLGTAVTGAVARALIEQGARDVALNVREDNLPAISAYRRIGFQVEEPFWEAEATLRA